MRQDINAAPLFARVPLPHPHGDPYIQAQQGRS